MTIPKPRTIHELRKLKGITVTAITKGGSRQTYYNMCEGKFNPTSETIEKMCKLLEVDKKTFLKLLKNTILLKK